MPMPRSLLLMFLIAGWIAVPRESAAEIETSSMAPVSLGATTQPDGWVAFGLHAPAAQSAALLLYDAPDSKVPKQSVAMTKIGDDWGVRIRGPGVGVGMVYMYSVSGHGTATAAAPFGTVLNGDFVLNDPYAYRTQEVGYSTIVCGTAIRR